MTGHATPKRAFTLIELLVVISIIALLIALLLPALGGAQAAGRRVTCLTQMREIYLANGMYATDHNEWIVGNDAHDYWPHWHSGDSWPWAGNGYWVREYLSTQTVWFCPEMPHATRAASLHSIENPQLGTKAWGTYSMPHYSALDRDPFPQPSRSPFQKDALRNDFETRNFTGSPFRSPLLTETVKFYNRVSYDGELFHGGGMNIMRRAGDGLFYQSDLLPLPWDGSGRATMEVLFEEMAE